MKTAGKTPMMKRPSYLKDVEGSGRKPFASTIEILKKRPHAKPAKQIVGYPEGPSSARRRKLSHS